MDSLPLLNSSQVVVPSLPSSSSTPPPSASSLPPLPPSPTETNGRDESILGEGNISPSTAQMMNPEDPSTVLESICQMEAQMSQIRTKVYELQELRHSHVPTSASPLPTPPPSGLPPSSSFTSTPISPPPQIDDLLILLNTHLEGVSVLVPAIQQRITRLLGALSEDETEEVRERWEEVEEEWEEVVKEVEGVKEELKEDRWLVVFRTAASQAEDMMESLEKVVSQCYDLIHKVRRLQNPPTSSSSPGPSRILSTSPPSSWGAAVGAPASNLTLASFETVLKSFEAKKKYYYPSVERVLSILDKGVRERVTRNGEVLLRHSTMLARWRSLSDKLNRLGMDLTSAHLWLLTRESPHVQQRLPRPLLPSGSSSDLSRTTAPLASPPPSEGGSSAGGSKYTLLQGTHKLQTPPSDAPTKSRRSSVASTFSRSMSPLQGMFGKMTVRGSGAGGGAGAARTPKESPSSNGRPPSSTGYFSSKFSSNKPWNSTSSPAPSTPRSDFFGASSSTSTEDQISPSIMRVAKPRWNASPKVPDLPPPSFEPSTPTGPRTGLPRRTSMANMRSVSGGPGGTLSPTRAVSPTLSDFGSGSATYRPPARPTTPSRIPRRQPSRARLSMDGEGDDIPTSMMQRAHTPTPLGNPTPSPRSHSKSNSLSLHPVPSLSVYPASEASLSPSINGSPSQFRRIPSPNPNTSSPPTTPNFNPPRSLDRSQTPDLQVRDRAIRSSFCTPAKPSSSSITPPSRGRVSNHTVRGGSPASTNPSPSGSSNPRSPPSSYRGDVSSPQPTPTRPRASNGTGTSTTTTTGPSNPNPPYSRPSSRAGASSRARAATPSGEGPSKYKPDKKNPLDVEIARIVNEAHNGIYVERIDPIPKGQLQASSPEANTAQYALFGGGGTKRVMSCRLLELNRGSRSGETTKVRKVMVRVGGGWLDLEVHVFKLGL